MTLRTVLVLAGIAVVVAGLAAWRESGRPGPSGGSAPPPAALPQVLDFGRDT